MWRLFLLGLVALPLFARCSAGEECFAESEKRIPFLTQRLHNRRWEVRYYLLIELAGKDEETKRLLEMLIRDENEAVANQALVRYLNAFVNVDEKLFDPAIYTRGKHPLANLPEENPRRALVEYCLGRRSFPAPHKGGFRDDDTVPTIPVLDVERKDVPRMVEPLTIVGMLGNAQDAEALYPFLESSNDYVVLGAAKAVIRLGDRSKGAAALRRLTEKEVSQNLYYITEALHALREIEDEQFEKLVLEVLAKVQNKAEIQPNWLTSFLLLATNVKDDVWE